MQHDSQNDATPLTAFLDASTNLGMALDRIGALFDAIQQRAEAEGSDFILTLAHLGAALTEQAEQHYGQLSEATKEWCARACGEENDQEKGED